MKTQDIKKIEKVVRENRLVSDRVEVLKKMGYEVSEFAMGPGGKLQQKIMSDGTVRVQIGYGHGRHNYAMAVTL